MYGGPKLYTPSTLNLLLILDPPTKSWPLSPELEAPNPTTLQPRTSNTANTETLTLEFGFRVLGLGFGALFNEALNSTVQPSEP